MRRQSCDTEVVYLVVQTALHMTVSYKLYTALFQACRGEHFQLGIPLNISCQAADVIDGLP